MKTKRFSEVCWFRSGRGDGTEDAGVMETGFLCSVPVPAEMFSSAALTTVSSLGAAPCCSRTLMMCVCPCCAAWCSGVYPFCRHRGEQRGQRAKQGCGGHRAHAAPAGSRERRDTHLRFGVNFRRVLQKEVHDFYVSVVAADVQRSVSHLE